MRTLTALFLISFQVGVGLTTSFRPVVAQTLPILKKLPEQLPSPVTTDIVSPNINEEISSQFNNYLLGKGDTVRVVIQRPPGPYKLGIGDTISVSVQRFPDLTFQAPINPEGNIVVPLLGTVALKGLTLTEAQEKIYTGLNRFVINPITVLSLVGQRPDLSFEASIGPDGNIVVPQAGKLFLEGLSLEEAQEKIRLALVGNISDPIVQVSLGAMRPVRITITGEVFRPGIYNSGSSMPYITDILPLAGGSNLSADLRKVEVRRKLSDNSIVSQHIDLYGTLQSGISPPDLRLQDGDVVIVPRREISTTDNYDRNLIARSTLAVPKIKVRVLNYAAGGIVTQSLPNGSTFVDALGGINVNNANLREIALIRFDQQGGKAITRKLDAKKVFEGDISQNVALQDEDVIVIGRNLIGKITNVLNTVTQPFFNIQGFVRFFQNFGSGIFGGNSD
ncbi:polysaccharide biosynthesis/export family protein [Cronbergia sp. UHCC 0137]|uniref:polysaccharide biosynthesis/export family protein n=1 Tax=Cronbergia sp. UHCC 0137 TaxID=3110239 RepID=UPI002B2044FB|nr:polysaccharide biosynthesis/export family protein [Cronbergia sp. UHCC 0137]MEA5618096.1 polysaccharide biosynthesis/export family protein [Cronbergia sp. UHCC 0137]